MKILYTALEYDYGDVKRGKSFEEYAFYYTFKNMHFNLIRYDLFSNMMKYGRKVANDNLFQLIKEEKPDVAFFVLFKDEADPLVLDKIRKETKTITLNWFCDDHWRFNNFSSKYAPHFDWITTTDEYSVDKYHKIGVKNVILTQWACNHRIFKRLNLPKIFNVSFIGQAYGLRSKFLKKLEKSGVNVEHWGYGSKNGRVSTEEMVKIINQSKINLNFSGSYVNKFKFWERRRDQIKARNFEIPGCGGFQLASYIAEINKYLTIDKDIVCYKSYDELYDKIVYYLQNESERENIALSGYNKILAEHTYEIRFQNIFNRIFNV